MKSKKIFLYIFTIFILSVLSVFFVKGLDKPIPLHLTEEEKIFI